MIEKPTRTTAKVARKNKDRRLVNVMTLTRFVPKGITPIAQRVDQPRAVCLQFPPQFHDVNFEGVGEAVIALVPNVFVNASAGQNLTGMAQEKNKECMFLGGQIEAIASSLGSVICQVDLHILMTQYRAVRMILASSHDPDAGQKFLEGEGLAEVIVRTAVQPSNSIREGAIRSHGEFAGNWKHQQGVFVD